MTKFDSTPTPKRRSKSRKPRRRIMLDDAHDAPAVPPTSGIDGEGAKGPPQPTSGGSGPYPSSSIDQPDDMLDDGLPDDHPAVRAFYDGADEDERVGYKRPPRKHQFKPKQSGNPSGTRKARIMPPGAVNSLIGKTVLEVMSDLMRSPVSDLAVHEDDNVATALAKRIVTDGVKNEGRSRTLLIDYYVEPQRTAERYQKPDHRAVEAEMLGEMARVMIDPTITDEEFSDNMDRWVQTKDEIASFKDGPLDELPPLPRPRRHRKTGKVSRRRGPRLNTNPTAKGAAGPKD